MRKPANTLLAYPWLAPPLLPFLQHGGHCRDAPHLLLCCSCGHGRCGRHAAWSRPRGANRLHLLLQALHELHLCQKLLASVVPLAGRLAVRKRPDEAADKGGTKRRDVEGGGERGQGVVSKGGPGTMLMGCMQGVRGMSCGKP
eukprot:300571-Chlamydomonas_euryale.AAC.3